LHSNEATARHGSCLPGGSSTWEVSDEARHNAGNKVGDLVSEGITLTIVPEPSTAALLAIGGALLGMRRRR
jgi:PEP-CTERM motif